ncbi:response regulator [Corallococcus sp. H22C18031201]|uniref:response regulator n=1 Tax=Citreicoccus inhibens TaxID=2849499 RepID=UPI000E759D56|nr:response regulator [Citreicoccus inhibens]MBU8897936.1 response regulator [Citreicoccus inhibens]RJS21727.1 response regulator [Corallococcus sp. H22C18031201]
MAWHDGADNGEELPWVPGSEAPPADPRVLIAEDDTQMRRLMAEALGRHGCDILEARDGRELIEMLVRGRAGVEQVVPDLIITDVRMPGCTGLEVLSRLRRVDWATPVILITAFGDEATHLEARRLGAAFTFDKPFDLDALCDAVRTLTGQS